MANKKTQSKKSVITKKVTAAESPEKEIKTSVKVVAIPKPIESDKVSVVKKSSRKTANKTKAAQLISARGCNSTEKELTANPKKIALTDKTARSKRKLVSEVKSTKDTKNVTGGEKNRKTETVDSNGAHSDALKGYMANIIQYSLITRQEEVELATQIHCDDPGVSTIARETLINANLRLVVKIAHDFKGFGLPLIDLVSEGNIGLMRAADKFDPAKGAKFSSYAAWWIKQSMRRALSNQSRTIRIPVQSATKINKIRSAQMTLTEKFGREPNYAEIALDLNFSLRTVIGLIMVSPKTISLHDPIQQGEDGEIQDIIPDGRVVTPDQIIADIESRQRLLVVMKDLDDRERQIIKMRFGLGNTPVKTLEDVSQIVGRTRERVRQIQNQALLKMRGWLIDEASYVAN